MYKSSHVLAHLRLKYTYTGLELVLSQGDLKTQMLNHFVAKTEEKLRKKTMQFTSSHEHRNQFQSYVPSDVNTLGDIFLLYKFQDNRFSQKN
jgi:hypothetical protein